MYFYDEVNRSYDEKRYRNENEKTLEIVVGKNKKFVVQKFDIFFEELI